MKIAVAQTLAVKGNVAANIQSHIRFIELACSHGAGAIFFPELSLTGYEPELANVLAVTKDDSRFAPFKHLSNEKEITIGVGAPEKSTNGIRISMVFFQPGTAVQTYSKQQLHADELAYFTAGEAQVVITVSGVKLAPAICYESLQPPHAEAAIGLGAQVYVASVAKSQSGVDKALLHYPAIAKRFSVPVLMANCIGNADNFVSVGGSAAWNKEGGLAGWLADNEEGILIFDTATEEVLTVVLPTGDKVDG